MSAILIIGLITGLIVYDISYNASRKYENQFQQAVAAAEKNDFEKALQLFRSLPSDYQGDWTYKGKTNKSVPVKTWINQTERYGTSDFIGEWQAGNWKLRIQIYVTGFNLSCLYSFDLASGSYDSGSLYIFPDGVTASFNPNSKDSDGERYKLVLRGSATMDVYYNGNFVVSLPKIS